MTPTISTARLSLRPLKKVTNANVAWLRDPEVVRYSEQRHEKHTLHSQLRYVNSFSGRSHLWGIHIISTGEHIGNITASHDAPNDVTEVGIMIGVMAHWGKGFGAEAWNRACAWLLDKDGGKVRKLEAGCMKNNSAMVKIITQSGFTQEGELLNHFLYEGNPISMMLYGRMK